jgi:hypothetical protein
MDVPTRQSYTMAVVNPEERSAAAGVLGVTRSTAAAISPSLAAPLYGSATLLNAPFLITGLVKIAYDLALYKGFRDLKPPEEES